MHVPLLSLCPVSWSLPLPVDIGPPYAFTLAVTSFCLQNIYTRKDMPVLLQNNHWNRQQIFPDWYTINSTWQCVIILRLISYYYKESRISKKTDRHVQPCTKYHAQNIIKINFYFSNAILIQLLNPCWQTDKEKTNGKTLTHNRLLWQR